MVNFILDMNEVLILGPKGVLQITPGFSFSEPTLAAAGFNPSASAISLSSVRSSIAGNRERTARSTAAEAGPELGR